MFIQRKRHTEAGINTTITPFPLGLYIRKQRMAKSKKKKNHPYFQPLQVKKYVRKQPRKKDGTERKA